MMRNKLLILILFLGSLGSEQALATTVKNLYDVKIPVTDQGRDSRAQAIKQAFETVLVRVTGSEDYVSSEPAQELVTNATRYMKLFRYEKPERKIDLFSDNPQPQGPDLFLVVSFDEQALNDALWKLKFPVWGKTRPDALVWLVVQDANGRTVVDANMSHAYKEAVIRSAERRGLPLLFPLMDLEDQMKVTETEIAGNFSNAILEASLRYGVEVVLIGRVSLDPFGQWNGRWTMWFEKKDKSWESSNEQLTEVLAAGVNTLAADMGARFANLSNDGLDNGYMLLVKDVKGLKDYVRTENYLQNLETISKLELKQVQADRLIYSIELRGQRDGLENAIKLGNTLARLQEPDLNEEWLNYRLQP